MTGSMVCFLIPVAALPLEAVCNKLPLLRSLYKRYAAFILKKRSSPSQGVVSSVLASGYAGVNRTTEYFQYKTYSNTAVVKIADSKIWICQKNGLMIGDMEAVTEVNFNTVIGKLKSLARQLGIRQIQFHTSDATALYDLFAAHYKSIPSYPMLFQDFGSAVSPEKIKFTFADIDIF